MKSNVKPKKTDTNGQVQVPPLNQKQFQFISKNQNNTQRMRPQTASGTIFPLTSTHQATSQQQQQQKYNTLTQNNNNKENQQQQQYKISSNNVRIQSAKQPMNKFFASTRQNNNNNMQHFDYIEQDENSKLPQKEYSKAQKLEFKRQQELFMFQNQNFFDANNRIKLKFDNMQNTINKSNRDYPKQLFENIQDDSSNNMQQLSIPLNNNDNKIIVEDGLIVLSPQHPYISDLVSFEFKYFRIPLKNKPKPVAISIKRLDAQEKFDLKIFTSIVNRNPNTFNTEQYYQNILHFKHTEPTNTVCFSQQDLFVSFYCNKDISIQTIVKYGNRAQGGLNSPKNQKIQTGEDKINEFLQQKNRQIKTRNQMLDYDTLEQEVQAIHKRRQDKVMQKSTGLDYIKENKKTKVYKPYNVYEKRHIQRVQSAKHINQVINRQQILTQMKKEKVNKQYQQKEQKLEMVNNEDYYQNLVSARKNTVRGQMIKSDSVKYQKYVSPADQAYFKEKQKHDQIQQEKRRKTQEKIDFFDQNTRRKSQKLFVVQSEDNRLKNKDGSNQNQSMNNSRNNTQEYNNYTKNQLQSAQAQLNQQQSLDNYSPLKNNDNKNCQGFDESNPSQSGKNQSLQRARTSLTRPVSAFQEGIQQYQSQQNNDSSQQQQINNGGNGNGNSNKQNNIKVSQFNASVQKQNENLNTKNMDEDEEEDYQDEEEDQCPI